MCAMTETYHKGCTRSRPVINVLEDFRILSRSWGWWLAVIREDLWEDGRHISSVHIVNRYQDDLTVLLSDQ
eukprot:m51a1_g12095 hypothetical protein (71) ;mRNA; r:309-4455